MAIGARPGLSRVLVILAAAALFAAAGLLGSGWTPGSELTVYLTWQREETGTSMTVNFYSLDRSFDGPVVRYGHVSHGGPYSAQSPEVAAGPFRVPGMPCRFWRAELTDLIPGTRYRFMVRDASGWSSKSMLFRTLPEDPSARPVRVVVGGDMGIDHVQMFGARRKLIRAAARENPDACLIGGDIAYANGDPEHFGIWQRWLSVWSENAVTPDGRLIPLILAIGNHDVTDDGAAPFYFALFNQAEGTCFARRLGPLARVFVLDSGHAATRASQADWLEAEFAAAAREVPYRLALYHVPFYPCHSEYRSPEEKPERAVWLRLFDRYRLTAAFEHHDHALKRTHPLRDATVVPAGEGTVYFGDGCFGNTPRTILWENRLPDGSEYLAFAASRRHFWRVDITRQGLSCSAIDEQGIHLNDYSIPRPDGPDD